MKNWKEMSIENRKYKKSTIAFMDRFLNHYGVENSLNQFLSPLSTYAIPEMEEIYAKAYLEVNRN